MVKKANGEGSVHSVPVDSDAVDNFVALSDFAFELEVFNSIRALKIPCKHCGLYSDPVTDISREYDFLVEVGETNILHLAVECKNIREEHPLVVQCVSRSSEESVHQLILNQGTPVGVGGTRSSVFSVSPSELYAAGKPVGKSFGQVGEKNKDTSNDPKFFDKYHQALQRTFELTDNCRKKGDLDSVKRKHFVLPIVVVPNDRLWQVVYTDDGRRGPSEKVKHISYKINKTWESGHVDTHNVAFTNFIRYTISHMEFVEIGYLKYFFGHYLGDTFQYENVFG